MTESFAPPSGQEMSRGTPQSLALGVEFIAGPDGDVMRVPFREDLVDDPAQGGLSNGVIVTLLDHACGFAIGAALRGRAEMEGRELRMGGMATLDFRIDYVRPSGPGLGVGARAECLKISGEVAFVRGVAFESDPDDPVAIAQAAFMISSHAAAA